MLSGEFSSELAFDSAVTPLDKFTLACIVTDSDSSLRSSFTVIGGS